MPERILDQSLSGFADSVTRSWWIPLIRGIAALAFGYIALAWPGAAFASLVILFGAWSLIDGAFDVGHAIATWSYSQHRWMLLLEGLLGIAIGVLVFWMPPAAALGLLWFAAFWFIAAGVFRIAASIYLRKVIEGEWLLVLTGFVAIAAGIFMLGNPGLGALAMTWTLGIFALIFGVFMCVLAFRLRSWRNRLHRTEAHAT
jgi:uncharacterized membrane protein HdeD (DUF308 family)